MPGSWTKKVIAITTKTCNLPPPPLRKSSLLAYLLGARANATRDNRRDAHNQGENAKLASTNIRGATRDAYRRFEDIKEERHPLREGGKKFNTRRRGE